MIDRYNDFLDGCCDLDAPMAAPTRDDQIDALVMFADVWDDPDAVRKRAEELRRWADAMGADDGA